MNPLDLISGTPMYVHMSENYYIELLNDNNELF